MAEIYSDENEFHAKKLKPTFDSIQKRFSCDNYELCVWRNCLLFRYSAIDTSDLNISINDYDVNDSILSSSPSLIPIPPPVNLAKTVFRIVYQSHKSVTITLYFTQSGGTLLCQGNDCPNWDTEECETLKTIVSSFIKDPNYETLSRSLIDTPLTFISAFSGSINMKSPSLNLTELARPSCDQALDDSLTNTSHLLLDADSDSAIQDHVIIFPPTPLVLSGSSQTQLLADTITKSTPVGKRTRRQCKRSLHKSSQPRTSVSPYSALIKVSRS